MEEAGGGGTGSEARPLVDAEARTAGRVQDPAGAGEMVAKEAPNGAGQQPMGASK
jgi:hypothetical protein